MVTQQFLMKPVCMFVVYANNSVGEVNVLALTSPLRAIEPSSLKAFLAKKCINFEKKASVQLMYILYNAFLRKNIYNCSEFPIIDYLADRESIFFEGMLMAWVFIYNSLPRKLLNLSLCFVIGQQIYYIA